MNEAGRRARLESALRQAMERAGAAEATIASVMAAGCRLDGVGAGGVSEELDRAGARLRRRIGELAAALDRLDAGRYGTCDGCGRPIDDARLDLLPEATLCRRCAGGAAGG